MRYAGIAVLNIIAIVAIGCLIWWHYNYYGRSGQKYDSFPDPPVLVLGGVPLNDLGSTSSQSLLWDAIGNDALSPEFRKQAFFAIICHAKNDLRKKLVLAGMQNAGTYRAIIHDVLELAHDQAFRNYPGWSENEVKIVISRCAAIAMDSSFSLWERMAALDAVAYPQLPLSEDEVAVFREIASHGQCNILRIKADAVLNNVR